MQTDLQTIDAKINQIPNWLMGSIFGGLVYVLLNLILFILPFVPLHIPRSLYSPLLWIVMVERELAGALLGVNPIVAGSIPYLLLGCLLGAVNSNLSRVVILVILLILAPVAWSIYIFIGILWTVSHW